MMHQTQGSTPLYKIGKQLGRGSFGDIYQGVNLATGQDVAIKVVCSLFHEGIVHFFVRKTNLVHILSSSMRRRS